MINYSPNSGLQTVTTSLEHINMNRKEVFQRLFDLMHNNRQRPSCISIYILPLIKNDDGVEYYSKPFLIYQSRSISLTNNHYQLDNGINTDHIFYLLRKIQTNFDIKSELTVVFN